MRRPSTLLFGAIVALAAMLAGCTSSSTPDAIAAPSSPVASVPRGSVAAGDAYVLLSGGGTPLTNNYSQYVQARAMAEFFQREFPSDATWVFFGIGNRDGAAPILADVRREVKQDGLAVTSWLPGSLNNNRPATRESFLRALREEILPRVRGGGTLYLFVGDHGEVVGKDEQRESAITLWQLKRGRRRAGGWITDEKEILGVAELRRVLADGLGQGRVVFCMTQCHSGGFHELGVARNPLPASEWFIAPPLSLGRAAAAAPRVAAAGFTATDLESPAAGCVADPDPERWVGYERFFPEQLLGVDLLSPREKSRAADSFAEAHEAATLRDRTIDKPRSTSEHLLDAWANVIETQLARSPLLTASTERALAAYRRVVDTGEISSASVGLRERHAQFVRFTDQLVADVPRAAKLLRGGTRAELEAARRGRGRAAGRGGRRGAFAELRRTWTETVRPAWKAAVLAGSVTGLGGPALEFEKHLLGLEDDGQEFLFPRGATTRRS